MKTEHDIDQLIQRFLANQTNEHETIWVKDQINSGEISQQLINQNLDMRKVLVSYKLAQTQNTIRQIAAKNKFEHNLNKANWVAASLLIGFLSGLVMFFINDNSILNINEQNLLIKEDKKSEQQWITQPPIEISTKTQTTDEVQPEMPKSETKTTYSESKSEIADNSIINSEKAVASDEMAIDTRKQASPLSSFETKNTAPQPSLVNAEPTENERKLEIEIFTRPTCNNQTIGSIRFIAPNDVELLYSVDGGKNYQSEPQFVDLPDGKYFAVAKSGNQTIIEKQVVISTAACPSEITLDPTLGETWQPSLEPNFSGSVIIENMAGVIVYSASINAGQTLSWSGTTNNGANLPSGRYRYQIIGNNNSNLLGFITLIAR